MSGSVASVFVQHRLTDTRRGEPRRNEIASCEEKAYDSLPLREAALLLFFDKAEQVMAFANEVRGRSRW